MPQRSTEHPLVRGSFVQPSSLDGGLFIVVPEGPMFASRLIIASIVVLVVGLYLFQSLWSERVYSWYRQPDEFWFSAVAMTFAVLVGVGMLVWGLAHIPLPFGR